MVNVREMGEATESEAVSFGWPGKGSSRNFEVKR
jgi:hypothetical protein